MSTLKHIPLVMLFLMCGCPDLDQHENSLQALKQAKAMVEQAADSKDKEANLRAAEEILRQAAAKDPDFIPLQIELVWVLWDLGDQLAGYRLSERIIERFPASPEAWDLHGYLLYDLGQWKAAAEALTKAIDLGAPVNTLLLRIGSAFGKSGDLQPAFEAFGRALEKDIPKEVVHFNMGLCYEKTGQEELAVEEYGMALEENAHFRPALLRLAPILLRDLMEDNTDSADRADSSEFIDRIPDEPAGKQGEAGRKKQPWLDVVLKYKDPGERIEYLIQIEEYAGALELVRKVLKNKPRDENLLMLEKCLDRHLNDE
jgi:tetratricopeptide (TPR) repeat protein